MRIKSLRLIVTVGFIWASLSLPVCADEISDLKANVKSMQNQINMLLNRIEVLEVEKASRMTTPIEVEDRVLKLEEKMQKPLLSKLANSSFNMKGYIQPYYKWEEHDSGEDTGELKRARLKIYGKWKEDFAGFIQLELAAGSDILRDAVVKYQHFSWARIAAGQMIVPYSYIDNYPTAKVPTIEFPLIATNLASVRDIGVMIDGNVLADQLYYAVGIFNGAGQNTSDDNENKDIVGRVIYSPFKNNENDLLSGFSVGGNIQTGRQPLSGNYEGDRNRYGGLLLYNYDKLEVIGEYMYQKRERVGFLGDETAQGWYLLGSYKITSKIKGVVMYEQYDPNMDISRDQQDILTLGGTYYFNDYFKIAMDYRQLYEQQSNDDTNNELIMQATFQF